MPDKCLLLLLDEVRAKTLRILKSVPAEHARWAPAGLLNNILWHAGHAYVLVEVLTMKSLERTPLIPDGWYEMFSPASHPNLVPADRWPQLPDVIHHLETQHKRLGKLIGELSEEQLDRSSATEAGVAGKTPGAISTIGPVARMTARSNTFSNSRTLPGQGYS